MTIISIERPQEQEDQLDRAKSKKTAMEIMKHYYAWVGLAKGEITKETYLDLLKLLSE